MGFIDNEHSCNKLLRLICELINVIISVLISVLISELIDFLISVQVINFLISV